jgi:ribosome-associated toxin RatA of RatAB toxin-antitoxin module
LHFPKSNAIQGGLLLWILQDEVMGLFGKKNENKSAGEENKPSKNRLSLQAEFNQSAQQIFGLVLDVEKYPQFVEGLEKVIKTPNGSNEMITEFVLSDKAFDEAKKKVNEKLNDINIPGVPKSLIEKVVPKSQRLKITWTEFSEIKIEAMDKPIDGLLTIWNFEPSPNGGTLVKHETDYSNTNFVVKKLLNWDSVQEVFNSRSEETIQAVKEQADFIFNGKGTGPKP